MNVVERLDLQQTAPYVFDENALERLRSGNDEEWERFVDHFRPVCMAYLSSTTMFGYEDRLDIVQEAMIKFFEKIDGINFEGNPFGYLKAAVRTTAVDLIRNNVRRPRVQLPQEDSPQAANHEEFEELVASKDGLERIFKLVPNPDQKRALYLQDVLGYTQEEIARGLGIPIGTLKTRNRRAKIAVREAFQNGYS